MKNKGFAITALLYGLSIMGLMTIVLMMSIMQNSRKNTSTLVRSVEQELNSYGTTAVDYTSDGFFTVPTDQAGYYKIELCGGPNTNGEKTLTSGSVYLPGGTSLAITVGDTSTVSVTSESVGEIMQAGNTTYVNGMAQFHSDAERKKYAFYNGQIYTKTSCTRGFTMNKVSVEAPTSGYKDYYNNVTKIELGAKANIYAVKLKTKTTARVELISLTTTNNKVFTISPAASILDMYIEYTEEIGKNSLIKLTTESGDTSVISPTSDSYDFLKTGYYITRYTPISPSTTTIKTGNYVISKVKKESGKYSLNPTASLSTSAYTPSTQTTDDPKLVYYGSSSVARPVLSTNYKGTNSQKWRIEYDTTNSVYKIAEIEEYKPFEVTKQDESTGTSGPVLVCGEYTWKDGVFTSTDNYAGNQNQQWQIEATGFGTFRFKTNRNIGTRYLYCTGSGDSHRCYVTSNKSDATIFQLINANV